MRKHSWLSVAGWAITLAVVIFMVRDVSPDLQQASWAVKANAGLGIPANIVLTIGIAGLVSTLLYAFPFTAFLGAILLTGFLGGAAFVHIRVNGSAWDVAENVLIGVAVWAGLWLRDARLRDLLPIRQSMPLNMRPSGS
jgi:protein-S-isoprenylcysteine O-methyltransferase Ste14